MAREMARRATIGEFHVIEVTKGVKAGMHFYRGQMFKPSFTAGGGVKPHIIKLDIINVTRPYTLNKKYMNVNIFKYINIYKNI